MKKFLITASMAAVLSLGLVSQGAAHPDFKVVTPKVTCTTLDVSASGKTAGDVKVLLKLYTDNVLTSEKEYLVTKNPESWSYTLTLEGTHVIKVTAQWEGKETTTFENFVVCPNPATQPQPQPGPTPTPQPQPTTTPTTPKTPLTCSFFKKHFKGALLRQVLRNHGCTVIVTTPPTCKELKARGAGDRWYEVYRIDKAKCFKPITPVTG